MTINLRTDYFYKLNIGLEYESDLLLIILHNKFNYQGYTGLPENGQLLYQLMVLFKQHHQQALRKVIRATQWNQLCPPNSQTSNSKTWDVTLICAVINNWPNNIPQLQNLLQVPQALLDIIDDIRVNRNEVNHKRLCDLQDPNTFNRLWYQQRNILFRSNILFRDKCKNKLAEFDTLGSGTLRFYTDKIVQLLEDAQKSLEIDVLDLHVEMCDLKTKAKTETMALQVRIDNQAIALGRLQTDFIEISKEKHKNLTSKLSNLHGMLEERLCKLEEEQEKVEEKQNEVEERQKEVEERQNNVEERQDDMEERQNEVEERQNEVEERQNEVVERQNEVGERQNEVEGRQNELKEKQNDMEEKQNEVVERQNEVKEKQNEVEERQNKVEKRQNIVEGKQNEVEERQNEVEERQKEVEEKQHEVVERQEKMEDNIQNIATERKDEKPFNDLILDEVLEYIIKGLSKKDLKTFVRFIHPSFKPKFFIQHRKRCDYLRQQKLRWQEVKERLLKMGKDDLVHLIVTKTNITEGLQKMIKILKEMIKDEYLQTSLAKPLLGPQGNLVFHGKDFEEIFVDLSIIHDSDVDEKALISDRQYHLKYNEARKSFISYKDISSMEERCILIQGVAGMGKSMLVRKLVSEWYEGRLFNGENGGTQTHLLLPILCRELNMLKVEPNQGFDDILAKLFPEIPCLTTLRNNDVNVLIVIDGIDELRGITTIKEEFSPILNFVKQLLDPRFMKQIRCMVVGRPHVINFLDKFYRQKNQRQPKTVQICGFNEENVKNYVHKNFKESEEDATMMLEKIKSSQVTKDLSNIPLYLEVLVNIFKDNPFATTPLTATELLLYNVLIFLRNQKPGERLDLGRFLRTYSTEVINFIREISKFSYETLSKNEIIFEADEKDVFEELVTVGLLLKSSKGESGITTYQFLHLTFQELFAAFHVLFDERVINLKSSVLRETLILAAGIQGISCGNYGDSKDYVLFSLLQLPEIKEHFRRNVIEHIRNDWISSDKLGLWSSGDLIVDAVYENQTCEGVLFNTMTVKDVGVYPVHFVKRNKMKLFYLINLLIQHNPDIRFREAFTLFPSDFRIMDQNSLFTFMSRCINLVFYLEKFNNTDFAKIQESLIQLTQQNALKELTVTNWFFNRTDVTSTEELVQLVFPFITKVSVFVICGFPLSVNDVQALSQQISASTSLRTIDFEYCSLTDELFVTLLDSLVRVERVYVRENKLTQLSLYHLMKRLTPTSVLKRILFGNNGFGDVDFDEIDPLQINYDVTIDFLDLCDIILGGRFQILSIAVRITKEIGLHKKNEPELRNTIKELAKRNIKWKLEKVNVWNLGSSKQTKPSDYL